MPASKFQSRLITIAISQKVIDRARLNAALVASRLSDDSRAAVKADGQEELATFYIEL